MKTTSKENKKWISRAEVQSKKNENENENENEKNLLRSQHSSRVQLWLSQSGGFTFSTNPESLQSSARQKSRAHKLKKTFQ